MSQPNASNFTDSLSKLNHFLVFIAVIISALEIFSHGRALDPDFWGQIAFGRHILEINALPAKDIYSYMPIKDVWINHEWGAAVIFFLIYDNLGGVGIMAFKMAVWMAITVMCYCVSGKEKSLPLFILVIYLISFHDFFLGVNNRPHLFTYLFFTLFLTIISWHKKNKNLIFLLPVINIFWANTHGGMVAGLGVLGLFLIGDWYSNNKFDFRIALSLALCVLSPLINPYGLDYYKYLLPAVLMNRWYIGEWQAMDLMDFDMLNNYKTLLVIFIISIPFLFERKKCHQYLILAFTTYVSLKHIRHTPFFLISCMAFLPGILSNVSQRGLPGKVGAVLASIPAFFCKRNVTSLIAIAGVIYCFGPFYSRFFGNEKVMDVVTPVKYEQMGGYVVPRLMVGLIKKWGLKGNMAVEFAWGEYIIWELGDRIKVSIDGRLETVYTKESIDAYFDFVNGRVGKWRRLLYDYDTELVLIRINCPVYPKMEKEKGWQKLSVYYDSALFVRDNKN